MLTEPRTRPELGTIHREVCERCERPARPAVRASIAKVGLYRTFVLCILCGESALNLLTEKVRAFS